MSDDLPLALSGRTFDVVAVDGGPLVEGPVPELTFTPEGSLHGRATVNRVNGRYEQDGDRLQTGLLATTLMAGSPEAMAQEARVLEVLAGPLTVVPHAEGSVLLSGDAGTLLLRERADAQPL